MIQDIHAALVALLEEERAPGRLLEGVATVRRTDAQPIPDRHFPAVTVNWDGASQLRADGNQVSVTWRYDIGLWLLNRESPEAAEEQLHRLMWREQGGASYGLLPALFTMRGMESGGHSYLLQVQDDVRTGVIEDGSRHTYGAVVSVTVKTMRRLPL